MCGRFTLRTSPREISELLGILGMDDVKARYNIAPTQLVLIARLNKEQTARELAQCRWGLIPSWAKDEKIGNSLINARCDTAATKPSFRSAMKSRRCLIPADGFYEWKKIGKEKQPYLIELAGARPFAFAGLWERWQSPTGPLDSCTILTTTANELLAPLHDRMPVILHPNDYAAWLDVDQKPDALGYLFEPYPAVEMQLRPVSKSVNNARYEGADCVEM